LLFLTRSRTTTHGLRSESELLTFPDGVALVLPSLPLLFSDAVVAAHQISLSRRLVSSHFSCLTWLGVSSLAVAFGWANLSVCFPAPVCSPRPSWERGICRAGASPPAIGNSAAATTREDLVPVQLQQSVSTPQAKHTRISRISFTLKHLPHSCQAKATGQLLNRHRQRRTTFSTAHAQRSTSPTLPPFSSSFQYPFARPLNFSHQAAQRNGSSQLNPIKILDQKNITLSYSFSLSKRNCGTSKGNNGN
jgi:hypothetical protein